MLKRILNTSDTFKKLPHDVKKITMKQSGSKYSIEVHCDNMPAVQIGRYDTREEALAELSSIRNAVVNFSTITPSYIQFEDHLHGYGNSDSWHRE